MVPPTVTRADFASADEPSWCKGCGNYGVLNAIKMALAEQGIAPHQVILFTGIGCGSKLPHYATINGFHGLHGRPLPVVSFEGALGKDVPVATGRTRIVVFYASAGKLRTGYFGILTQGFPQLVRVNKDVLKLAAKEGWPEGAPVLCKVKMINEYPLIPDLEKLETLLAAEAEQA